MYSVLGASLRGVRISGESERASEECLREERRRSRMG
jgi:hypothetical protein